VPPGTRRYGRDVAGKGATLSQSEAHGAKRPECAPYLFLEIECERPLAGPARYLLAELESVRLGRGPRRMARVGGDGVLELVLPDGWISEAHAELRRQNGRWTVRDLGSKNGTLLDGERIQTADLPDQTLFQLGRTFFSFRGASCRFGAPLTWKGRTCLGDQVGLQLSRISSGMCFFRGRAAGTTRVPVVLHGESGTGKEVLARARAPFSGAERDRPGPLRTSDGGTLFLDEIGGPSTRGPSRASPCAPGGGGATGGRDAT
jgi:hypothetical protein